MVDKKTMFVTTVFGQPYTVIPNTSASFVTGALASYFVNNDNRISLNQNAENHSFII
jgi:hypothetical protein